MASPDSASPTLAGRGSMARGWRRAPAAAFVVLLAAAATACTKPEPAKPPVKTPASAKMVTGKGLPICTDALTQGVKLVMRIYVLTSFDKVFSPTAGNKPVYYRVVTTAETDAEHAQYDFAPGTSNNSTSSDATIISNLYHSDVVTTGVTGQGLAEYRIIIENGPASPVLGQNMKFYTDSTTAQTAVRGIAVNPDDPDDFVCSNNVIEQPNSAGTNTHSVADFFVKLRPATGSYKYDSFNVVIVPKTGNADTPLMIDPKIRNNG